jgi:phosphatidylserine synthase
MLRFVRLLFFATALHVKGPEISSATPFVHCFLLRLARNNFKKQEDATPYHTRV